MTKLTACSIVIMALSGCASYEIKPDPAGQHNQRAMPQQNQGISPAQRRAIMSGERPDWSDMYPERIFKNASEMKK